jgi:hypothetical protein
MAGSKERFFDLGSSSDTEDYGDTDSLRYPAFVIGFCDKKCNSSLKRYRVKKLSCSSFSRILLVAQFVEEKDP